MAVRLESQTMRIPIAMVVVIPRQNSDILRARVIRVFPDPVFRLRMPVAGIMDSGHGGMDWGESRNNIMH